MATLVFPVREQKNGSATLLPHLEAVTVDEIFPTETDFEDAVVQIVDQLAEVFGETSLMLIGRQVPVKPSSRPGRNPTLDLYLVSGSGRRYILELKIAFDRGATGQVYSYGAQLRHDSVEETCEIFAAFLSTEENQVTVEQAADRLADFLGVPVDYLEETDLLEKPALVVVTPEVNSAEYAAARAMDEDGNMTFLICTRVYQTRNEKHLVFEKFYPPLNPATENAGKKGRRRSNRDDEIQVNSELDAFKVSILQALAGLEDGSQGIVTKSLRAMLGTSKDFTAALGELAEEGLILRSEGVSDKPGRKPLLNRATSEGRAALNAYLQTEEPDIRATLPGI